MKLIRGIGRFFEIAGAALLYIFIHICIWVIQIVCAPSDIYRWARKTWKKRFGE